jgi:ABC-type transport system involved in cytochrome c biogenesis permease subunit
MNYIGVFIREDALARKLATSGLAVAVALHALSLLLRGLVLHRHPIANPLESMTMIAFAVAVVHLYVEVTHKNQAAGAFVIGLVFVFQLVASAFMGPTGTAVNPLLRSPLFGIHTGSAILGYSGFAVSAAYGILFLLLYREIKASRFGLLYERLPSLDLLALMSIRAAAVGLFFLSIAIIVGLVWSSRLTIDVWHDPKFIFTIMLWAVYSLCLGAYYALGWSGRRVVFCSLIGFAIMLFSMAVVHLLFRSFHNFALLRPGVLG